jgi:DNA-binding winged helix-turn-helix (wHTH) protein
MTEAEKSLGSVRFGPFELVLETQELRKHGVPMKLSGQTIQVLAVLTTNPGKLVTREELQKKLWPGDSFGDFEHGLNAAINKLRDKLGDSAATPTYVETLPGRGYRFIGRIETEETKSSQVEPEPPKLGWKVKGAVWLALAGVCVLLALGFYWLKSPQPPPRVLRYRQLTSDRQIKNETPCGYDSLPVTDGPRVFFSEPSSSVVQVSSVGGDVTKVPNPFVCFSISDISPDKTELLGVSVTNGLGPNHPLWVFSIASGQARRVGNLTGHAGAWSPDGQRIVYAIDESGGSDLYIAAKDDSEARNSPESKKDMCSLFAGHLTEKFCG